MDRAEKALAMAKAVTLAEMEARHAGRLNFPGYTKHGWPLHQRRRRRRRIN